MPSWEYQARIRRALLRYDLIGTRGWRARLIRFQLWWLDRMLRFTEPW